MAELFHECGVAAIYHLPEAETSELVPRGRRELASRLMSQLLLDIQNRGQLAAGMTSFNPERNSLLRTHRDVGTVTEVFHLNHAEKYDALMDRLTGPAAIGHTRYATCGKDDRSYAQPFERHHIQKSKWFSFAFNGRLANYQAEKYADRDDVEVIKADAVQLDLRRFFVDGPVKLIGNLPYSCGGEIIRNFLPHLHPTPICEAVLMLQKEVGERICTGPGSKAYGKNSVRVQVGWKPRIVRELPPEWFHPAPTIDSAIPIREIRRQFTYRDRVVDGRWTIRWMAPERCPDVTRRPGDPASAGCGARWWVR